jgi:hypothetical protein
MVNLMNNELQRMWKKAVMAHCKLMSPHVYEGTEENHEKFLPG